MHLIVNHSSPFWVEIEMYRFGFSRCGKQLAAILVFTVFTFVVGTNCCPSSLSLDFFFFNILNVLDLT